MPLTSLAAATLRLVVGHIAPLAEPLIARRCVLANLQDFPSDRVITLEPGTPVTSTAFLELP